MARVTKADLEKEIQELKERNQKLLNILNEDNQRYNELVEKTTKDVQTLPEYQRMVKEIKQLEEVKRLHEDTIQRHETKEKSLRNKIQELLSENEHLKKENEKLKANKPIYNARGAGRKPMSQDKVKIIQEYLEEGKTDKEIWELTNISKSTFYRVKKSLQEYQN